ncbi:MAG: sugar phosphate isomerase/epimerase family protein [Candidatus Hydrogenedentales bacterium]|jgi:sugar phosphate isomerase/epimerase
MMTDIDRLCIHTMTTKPWSLKEATDGYVRAGVPGITVWRQHLQAVGTAEGARILRESGLRVVSLCRGGFFPADTAEKRQEAIDDNRRAIDEAAAISAPLIVLVCGAVPGMTLKEARKHIGDGISAVLPYAESAGVKLSIEPLHPMYADSRSAINTLAQANELSEAIESPWLGVTVDVYHLWWDPDLQNQIRRAGGSIFSFHVCDWLTPTCDLLNDRGLMGEGCINIPEIRSWVESTGYDGPIEVEIFSDELWATDQVQFVERIKQAYLEHV